MKIIIYKNVNCDYDEIRKKLPPQFAGLINKAFFGKTVTLVLFPLNKSTIISSYIEKANKKLKADNNEVLYFARCFTMEAVELIRKSNGTPVSIIEFPWTDERYNHIHNGEK